MKTLSERLKPEFKADLDKAAQAYPSTIKQIYFALENNTCWGDLTYEKIVILFNYLDLADYSPSSISNLFYDGK
jgi:hypothetical protein